MKRATRILTMLGLAGAGCCCFSVVSFGIVQYWPKIASGPIGPFFLPVDVPLGACCCSIGLVMGLTMMGWFSIATSGDAQKRTDQDLLFEILTAGHGIRSDLAFEIIDKSGSIWSNIRKRSRPILWRLAMDWPEFGQGSLKKDVMEHFGGELSEDSEMESEESSWPTETDYPQPSPDQPIHPASPQPLPDLPYSPLPDNPEAPWLGPSSPTLTDYPDD